MFRPAARALLRRSPLRPSLARPAPVNATRSLGTAAPKKSSFKSTAVRWALAGGVVYWYATSNVFADEPKYSSDGPSTSSPSDDDRPASLLPKHSLRSQRSPPDAPNNHLTVAADTPAKPPSTPKDGQSRALATGPEELEEDTGQQGAFNPETGEINWDCPCLGGMADGPCGEPFKAAFSCFVFSKEDPKGVDCIERFKDMQTCFQQHPEVYGSELDGDEDEEDEEGLANRKESADTPADTTDLTTTPPVKPAALSSKPSTPAEQDTPAPPAATATAESGPAAAATRDDEWTTHLDTREGRRERKAEPEADESEKGRKTEEV